MMEERSLSPLAVYGSPQPGTYPNRKKDEEPLLLPQREKGVRIPKSTNKTGIEATRGIGGNHCSPKVMRIAKKKSSTNQPSISIH